ncbi:pyridoxal phosphate-dependent aminotransferase [Tenacibaculum sp. C7A-26P2]|uniref:pyridoxal phosphate-dependent aminotransferase n=1 Tax=Tenacibaculum sp. C7A-26P2 TaxID=3447504 RepID=UPI003F87FA4A
MIIAANRLKTVQEYYFSKKLREVNQLTSEGKPIINMGIGSPDMHPPKAVINAIQNSLTEENAHKYQSYQGLPEFRDAIASFYKKKYNVTIDPQKEILPLMGSKEGIMHISLAFLNEGDHVLIPNPGYPTYSSVTKLVGAEPIFYNLKSDDGWQPNFIELEKLDLKRVKLMWVNYPHMPTGAKAKEETLKQLVLFGKKHKIIIVNDNPYSFILNKKPQSIFQIEGAKNVALELNSLSKSFNMAGWRVGKLIGNPSFVNEILKVKTQMDSGMFYGIQKGAIKALELKENWFSEQNEIYKRRQKLIFELSDILNCKYDKNAIGMFVWAKLQNGKSSESMVDHLLYDKNIFVAPGSIFGSQGEGYIRFSLCLSETKIKEAITRF